MRQYIIALHVKLPPNQTPESWLIGKLKLGSIDLESMEVHYEEIKDESETKSDTKTRSSGKTTGNSNKTQS